MPATRKCAKCGEPTLEPVSRRMEIYNSVYAYKCSSCQNEIELKPAGGLGMQVTIGLLFTVIVWIVFMDNHGAWPGPGNMPTIIQSLVLLGIALFFPLLALFEFVKHRRSPLVDQNKPRQHMQLQPTKNLTKKPVIWIEKFGFIGGMLAPVVVIVVVLGMAALIGYINFTFFNDKLFG